MKKILLFLMMIAEVCFSSEFDKSFVCIEPKTRLLAGYCLDKNRRTLQEDALAMNAVGNGDLFCVADGNEGSAVARYVTNKFHKKFAKELAFSHITKEKAFKKVLNKMEEHALAYLIGGAAVVAAYVEKANLHIAWVGNAQCALYGLKNNYITPAHCPANEKEKQRIVDNEGTVFRSKIASRNGAPMPIQQWRINWLKSSRIIGDNAAKGNPEVEKVLSSKSNSQVTHYYELEEKLGEKSVFRVYHELYVKLKKGQIIADPEYKRILLEKDDRWLVLATDGLWDVLTKEQVFQIIKIYEKLKPSKIAQELVKQAKKNNDDNIAVIVVDLSSLYPEKQA